jgi:general secretion pathway protein K
MLAPNLKYQAGVALLAALVLIMTLAFILSNIFYRHQIDISQTSQALYRDQALLLAISGENWARQMLDNDDKAVDDFGELWAQAIPAMPVDGGMINGCISDLQGRFNLNSFSKYNNGLPASALTSNIASEPVIWNQLLQLFQMPVYPGRVETIIDWLDSDSDLTGSYGAEQDDYAAMLPPRMAADQMMVEPSELASVIGYEIFEVQALMPWLSALPSVTKININTASDELLIAIGGDLDTQFRDAVIANRPFNNVSQFWRYVSADLGMTEDEASRRWPDAVFNIKTEYFQLYIEVLLGDVRIEVKSVINRPSNGKPVIISRDITTVPASLPKNSASKMQTLASPTDNESDKDAENSTDNTDMQPACLMIEAY